MVEPQQQTIDPLATLLKSCLSLLTGGVFSTPESQVSAGITPSITNVPVDTDTRSANLLILLKGDLS